MSRDTAKGKAFAPKATKLKDYHPDSLHSPTKAWHRSLIFPGLGQAYNRKWWKLPIIYAGLGFAVYMYYDNSNYYKQVLALAKYRQKGVAPRPDEPYYAEYNLYERSPDQSIYDAVRVYGRYRDLSVLGFVLGWGIQVIDAYVDAKFMHSYSMDNNFSVKLAPTMMNNPVYAQNFNGAFIPGLKLTFTLR